MIVVLLIFFRSICEYFQQLVLKVHDLWLNPQHGRLYVESTCASTKFKDSVDSCRFCANSPKGHCRHHSSSHFSKTNSSNDNNRKSSWFSSSKSGGGIGGGATKFCKCLSCTYGNSRNSLSSSYRYRRGGIKASSSSSTVSSSSSSKSCGSHSSSGVGFFNRFFFGDDDDSEYETPSSLNNKYGARRSRKIRTRI